MRAAPLLLIQLVSGAWQLSQSSFFPIYLQERLEYAPVVIAGMIAAGQVAGTVAGLTGGALSDRMGSKWVLALGLAGAAVASFVYHTQVPWLVAALWCIYGLAIGLYTLGGSSYLTTVVSAGKLGLLSAGYALCLTLGGAIGNPGAGALLDRAGFGPFGLAVLVLALLSIACAILLLGGRQPNLAAERVPWRVAWSGAFALVRSRVPLLLIGLRFLPTLYYGSLTVLMPLLINQAAGRKSTVAAYATASLVGASVVQLLAGRAADRYGRRIPALAAFSVLILSGLGLAVSAQHLWGLIAFGVVGTAAAWALSTLMFCLVADGVAPSAHGRMFGLLHAAWSIAMIAGSLTGGALVRLGPGLPFLVTGLLNIASIGLAMAYFAHVPVTSGKTLSAEPM